MHQMNLLKTVSTDSSQSSFTDGDTGECLKEYLAHGGQIQQLKPGKPRAARQGARCMLFEAIHHRFPSPEALATAHERSRQGDNT